MEQVDYNKKIKTCERLGAKQFQKFVFKIENVKWKIIKKHFPSYLKKADKIIDKNKNKRLKKATTTAEKEKIKMEATFSKMNIRKEFNNNSNMNYHINTKHPTEFIEMLNWNKDVHKRNLIWNSIILPASIVAIAMGNWIGIPIAIYEATRMFINFECINIQNYNIYRIKRIEKKLIEKAKKQEEKNIEKYSSAYEVIGKKVEEKKDIVSIDEIVDSINSKEQLLQLKELIKQEKLQRQKVEDIKGGKRK